MSSSLTVIGSHSGATLTGLVSIPAGFISPVNSSLQTLLTSDSNIVTAGGGLLNFNIAGLTGSESVAPGSGLDLLELTNYDSANATVAGNASVSFTVPSGYSTLVVEAPGAETITGNGQANATALFGANSTVTYTELTGSGSVYASGNANVLVDGTAYSVIGGTVGGNAFNVLSNTGAVTTEGGANIIFIAGLSDSVVSNGSNDFIASAAASGNVTVSGFANFIGTNGSNTVTAIGTGSFNGFIDKGYAGTLDFINMSSQPSTVTGLAGSVTVYGGAGGGHYEGGALGNNSLYGGTGLATLDGSASGNDTMDVGGSVSGAGFNVINAGAQDGAGNVTTGGNQVLISESTAGTTYFHTNTGNDLVTASGGGTQYVYFNAAGNATVLASSEAVKNQFYLSQTSIQGGNTDEIKNFNYNRDNFSLVNSPGVFISGSSNGQSLGGTVTGAVISLSNGTHIELVGVTLTANQMASLTVPGATSF